MQEVPKIIVTQRPSFDDWKAGLNQTSLLLISFDTAAVARINHEREGEFKLSMPARYAVRWHQGIEDDGVVAQTLLYGEDGNAKAEWLSRFADLPRAIQALRDRYPDVEIPDTISYVIDWPIDRRAPARSESCDVRIAVVV